MCVLFYIAFVCVHVCAYTLKFRVHCGSTFESGASALPSALHLCVLIDGSVGINKKNGNFRDIEEKSNLTKLKVCDKKLSKTNVISSEIHNLLHGPFSEIQCDQFRSQTAPHPPWVTAP